MTKIILSDVSAADAEHIARYIEIPAMQHNPLRQHMFPSYDSLSLERKQEIILWYTNMLEEAFTVQRVSFLKATGDNGTVYGYCRWTFECKNQAEATEPTEKNPQQDTERNTPGAVKKRNWIPEALDDTAWVTVSQALRAERNRVLENLDNTCRKYIASTRAFNPYLLFLGITMMAVDPKYQRQGIGSRLMERMCEEIDRHGRYTYVLASPEGVRLYSKFGFVAVGEAKTDKGVITSMLRHPHPHSQPSRLLGAVSSMVAQDFKAAEERDICRTTYNAD